jgi:cytidyltransferase-like protein
MPKDIVLATGVFDILHDEHRSFLRKAKALGGKLIVGIESDVRVRQLKGPTRPIHPQSLRKENLEKLGFIDEVFVLPDAFSEKEQHRALLATIHPTILAVSENTPFIESKQQLMQEIGGRVVIVHKHNPAISTSKILAEHAAQNTAP